MDGMLDGIPDAGARLAIDNGKGDEMNAADWITDRMPTTPEPDSCDYRTSSAPCLIQTVNGGLYTAQWVVYTDQDDDGIPPCWELCGREGLQLDREEVMAWQPIVRYAGAA